MMERLTGKNLEKIKKYFDMAAENAAKATCLNAKCGSAIIKNNKVIGKGYNAPPMGDEANRMCKEVLHFSKKPNYDITCCVHAEWQAILEACKHFPKEIPGSTLYYMRINENNQFTDAGEPYCTNCSRLAMEAGIANFGLWNNNGADIYEISEYNQKSYRFFKNNTL